MEKTKYTRLLSFLMGVFILTASVFWGSSYADQLTPYRQGYIEGFLKSKGTNQVQIEEYDGTLHTLTLDKNVRFTIDTIPASYVDFKYGMEIYATLKGRAITSMQSYSTENPGYISEGSKTRTGTIKKIDRNQITIKNTLGKETTYFTSPGTIVLKNSRNVSLNTLYEGDRVKLFFDAVDTDIISRMQVEGNSILIKDVYKGTIAVSDPIQNILTLSQVQVLKDGSWQSLQSSMSIPYNNQMSLYTGGVKIPFEHLKYYKGKTVYMAVKDFFGKSQIEKMVVKGQFESIYSEKIKEINWYQEAFELSNNKNLSFNDGTLIIKNGRLVDKYSIASNSDAFIVGDGRGSTLSADVVYIYNEDINNSNIGQDYLYEGRLDVVLKDQVVLKNFTILNKNAWESFDGTKELYYDDDIMIYDVEAKKRITKEQFYSGDYAVDEDSRYARDRNLKDWYAYVYADGDRISSIMVQKKRDSLLSQRVSNGVISVQPQEDALVGWKATIKDAKDWSDRKESWMAKTTSLNILLNNAMIIKEGKLILPEDLNAGDRLYILRDDNKAKVIIVK